MSRPNRKMYETGPEITYEQDQLVVTLRQVGWIGQSGDFYSLDEDPSKTEPGSFSPLYFTAHADRAPLPEGG